MTHPEGAPVGRLDLEAIRKRCEAATPAPWMGPRLTDDSPPGWIGVYEAEDDEAPIPFAKLFVTGRHDDASAVPDAEFIAHAREDIPLLIAEVERQAAEVQRLRALTPEGAAAPARQGESE